MKRTELRRKTSLRPCSPKRAAAMATEVRRGNGLVPGQQLRATSIKPNGKRLRQGRSTGKPTAAQADRFGHIVAIGCLACLLDGHGVILPEVHHLTLGGYHGSRRRGHDCTIGLCGWHHQGEHGQVISAAAARDMLGPSYKRHKMAFRERYGTDDQLLETQNKLIALRMLEVANGR